MSATNTQTYHHGNLKHALIDAGLAFLASEGHAEISVRELARSLGVSANAAYRHFKNKDDLLAALAIAGCTKMLEEQERIMATTPNPEYQFYKIGRAYVNYAVENPALFQLIFGRFTGSTHHTEVSDTADRIFYNLLHIIAAVVQQDVQHMQVTTLATQAWSLAHGLSLLILNGQLKRVTPNLNEMIDQVFKIPFIVAPKK